TELLKNNLQQQKLRELTDPLTKLPNRQAYNERLFVESNRFKRYQKPLSLILGDIDLFKKINDTHGHVFGDVALRETASILQNSIRATDFVARFGGEEFIIIMPETNMAAATKAVNKLRIAIQNNQITESITKINLTMSFGVAAFTEGDSSKSVLERADKALYRAKSKGRNQVCAQRK
ncbi:MAG: GGDEF domain-containing protein, partial [Gammaproteobacteria bacterium]|nr:GGDEF domain-containing protein [Gammaproteobacteria bacterium]